jgi:flagellar basal-body rod protein FlgG
LAIHGNGFFKVTLPDGTDAFSRDGAFKKNNSGGIVTSDGLPVTSFAGVTVPSTATNLTISQDGTVSLTDQGVTSTVGQITLSRFANPAGMESIGGSLYRATLASGTEETGTPALAGMGSVQQGYLELSNVKVVEEMVNLIKAQRAYEINSKAIQAADEMMSMSNRLRG